MTKAHWRTDRSPRGIGIGRWRLTDAKARFSEVVKLAQREPQRVTLDGRDTVVIVSAQAYDELHGQRTGAELLEAFADPRLNELDLESAPVTGSFREVEL